jgi:hypothetical protein
MVRQGQLIPKLLQINRGSRIIRATKERHHFSEREGEAIGTFLNCAPKHTTYGFIKLCFIGPTAYQEFWDSVAAASSAT